MSFWTGVLLRFINGIGLVYEKRLNEAGIQTFAELAALALECIRANH